MKKIIAGNWKMNLTKQEATFLTDGLLAINEEIQDKNVILFPNFLLINELIEATAGSNLKIGAQNCADHVKGAYTGEVSPMQLADLNCKYCLIGHSERRNIYNETDEQVKEKTTLCLEHGITPIVCIGENLESREKGEYINDLKKQLDFVSGMDVVIAYEPCWSIGTGKIPTIKEIAEITEFVHSQGFKACLYGGSVTSSNATEILGVSEGVLVGGASLKVDEFVKIIFA